jgi:murein DD-endopeptidase MepM/ murein hydrolase activator NlpD
MSDYKTAFFEQYAAAAMEQQQRYGIPASVTLAQMAVESGYGESSLAKQDNNFFGIKASKAWQDAGKPWSYHHDDHYNDKFCTFGSALESMEYHSKVLMADRYKACRQYAPNDHLHWIEGIKKGGYATDPRYVATIESVIKKYGLDKYDRQAMTGTIQQGTHYSFPLACNQAAGTLTVTSPYGHRQAPKAGASTNHMGLDLRANYVPVLATEDNGIVISAKNEGKGGNVIRVEYARADGTKYQTAYMHLSQMNVAVGDSVSAGMQLGVSGNTGNSTGPHLHFSVRKVGADGRTEQIDPSIYLAEIAVKGGIGAKVMYNGQDLLASHKADVRVDEVPYQDNSNMLLADMTQSNDPKDWLAYLLSDDAMPSISNSADPMGALIGSVFSGLLLMVSQLDSEIAQTETVKQPDVVSRERAAPVSDYSQVLQSSSAYFEAGMQQDTEREQAIAIK